MVATRMRVPVLGLLFAVAALPVAASDKHSTRSSAVEHEFQKQHPCPATGSTEGACPGYVRDHIVPLACGGPDAVGNLQWQTLVQAKAKDKVERRGCRSSGSPHHQATPRTRPAPSARPTVIRGTR